jgi:hypothetical protein
VGRFFNSGDEKMTSAYVEHRPLSDDKDCPVTGYVVIVKHPDGETEEATGSGLSM